MREVGERLGLVPLTPQPLDRFSSVLEPGDYYRLLEAAAGVKELLAGRIVWNVSSTSRGGGVAEMLASLLRFVRGAGVDGRWLVVHADPEFFRLTKRIHNCLHGAAGDGGELGLAERVLYEAALQPHADELEALVAPGDIVILHDPQTAGLVPAVRRTGAKVVWRCHVGVDVPTPIVRRAWEFLLPYVEPADACIFSRGAYAWDGLAPDKVVVIPPSIDAFSSKNQLLSPDQVEGILTASGLVAGQRTNATFTRADSATGQVFRHVELLTGAPVPKDGRIVTQVSRWDRLKDPLGVIDGFVQHVLERRDAHLVLAGPAVTGVSDDPEGLEVVREVLAHCALLSRAAQARVHLACLPMEDIEENAAMVNALQRRAAVVVQKSLAEGFGLTVAEAMWKSRAIVASRIGGIQDQVIDGVSGILVGPTDLLAYGRAVTSILDDPSRAMLLGQAAHRRCRDEYLAPRHLLHYVELCVKLLS